MDGSAVASGLRHADPLSWSEATHERNMRMALVALRRATALSVASLGAVLVDSSCRVVASATGHLLGEGDGGHPELSAIRLASGQLGRPELPDLVLYSTLEPCPACLDVCAWVGLAAVYYGVDRVELGLAADEAAVMPPSEAGQRGLDRKALLVRGPLLGEEAAALWRSASLA